MKYSVVQCESSHIDEIIPLGWFQDSATQFKNYHKDPCVMMFTILCGDKPASIVGGFEIHKGVCQLFSCMSELITQNVFNFSKRCLWLLNDYQKVMRAHRVQMYVDCNYKKAARFAEFLGFEREGLMLKFGPDKKDYFLYARTTWQR